VGFEELAAAMGVSKGRVSQLHGRALASIRQTMAKHRLAEFI
jgi:DNA-directed RNA polymerase specialized sigma subunit